MHETISTIVSYFVLARLWWVPGVLSVHSCATLHVTSWQVGTAASGSDIVMRCADYIAAHAKSEWDIELCFTQASRSRCAYSPGIRFNARPVGGGPGTGCQDQCAHLDWVIKVFASESDPSVQAHLLACGNPGTLFIDNQFLRLARAPTHGSTSATATVRFTDIFIAGFTCKTLSALNTAARSTSAGSIQRAEGKTGESFEHVAGYVEAHKPTAFILENVPGALRCHGSYHIQCVSIFGALGATPGTRTADSFAVGRGNRLRVMSWRPDRRASL
jgi:hypothetical protein